jgi:hypothetical protein
MGTSVWMTAMHARSPSLAAHFGLPAFGATKTRVASAIYLSMSLSNESKVMMQLWHLTMIGRPSALQHAQCAARESATPTTVIQISLSMYTTYTLNMNGPCMQQNWAKFSSCTCLGGRGFLVVERNFRSFATNWKEVSYPLPQMRHSESLGLKTQGGTKIHRESPTHLCSRLSFYHER